MTRYKIIIPFIISLFILIQCTHYVKVPLQPNYEENLIKENALSSVQPAIKFKKGKFTDKRADTSNLSTFKQQANTFILNAERPVDEAIFDGLKALLSGSGHEWSESDTTEVRIDMQLLSLHASRNAGMVTVTASSNIQIKLDFVSMKTDEIIYTGIYNGIDDRGQAMVGLMSMVIKSIDASIIDSITVKVSYSCWLR